MPEERRFSTGEVVLLMSGFVFLALIWATAFWAFTGYIDLERIARRAEIHLERIETRQDIGAVEDRMTDIEIQKGIESQRLGALCERVRIWHGLPSKFCDAL